MSGDVVGSNNGELLDGYAKQNLISALGKIAMAQDYLKGARRIEAEAARLHLLQALTGEREPA